MLGPEGCGDITTRANFQIRGISLDNADKIFHGLRDVGLSSVQSGDPLDLIPGIWSDAGEGGQPTRLAHAG